VSVPPEVCSHLLAVDEESRDWSAELDSGTALALAGQVGTLGEVVLSMCR